MQVLRTCARSKSQSFDAQDGGPVHCGVGRLLEERISDKISHRILDQGMIVGGASGPASMSSRTVIQMSRFAAPTP